jgi:hypothetical protein
MEKGTKEKERERVRKNNNFNVILSNNKEQEVPLTTRKKQRKITNLMR